ncbi:uncharacterized protein LOC115454178 isoform X1 [Manduca sexta]|uniref:uncharacterized protein LOC115454178 isoform X1 n=1 Tax=Manduca sexta TaxID=7130 RepID=UPI0018906553|nr:uncharacterized protein LOC115454178 isoform X1 [Manduca sexta]
MNTVPENNLINSSQYTPVYLIQNAGPTQANYIISLGNVEQKPVSDNLKSFYEKSGNIEAAAPTVVTSPKPRILKKPEAATVGNNLKLASFLLPKNDNVNKQYVVNNVILKPSVTTPIVSTVNTIPKIDIDRKIVKLKDVPPLTPRSRPTERFLPKIKPKENITNQNQAKLTSVQLLKLGETYHRVQFKCMAFNLLFILETICLLTDNNVLNKLSEEQMKMVNQALKIFSDPEKIAPEPTYDPVTNTKFIYKVVSPRDLTVVGKKNLLLKEKKEEKKPETKKDTVKRQIFAQDVEEEPSPPTAFQTKVTRSGRTVKLPKLIVPQETPYKPKKKNHIVTCFQCSTEFSSLYRLQKHYENHPTHIPAKIHSNLFHCLLAIVKGGSEEDRTKIFIQQLEQLIVKLKSLLPCLLNKIDGKSGKPCTINDDVGRIFGMDPGKYDIDVNALNCVKDKDGFCVHNPPVNQVNSEVNQLEPTQIYITTPSEELPTVMEEDCARISSAENWPTVSKRVWKLKKLKSQKLGTKKMRIETDNNSLLKLDMSQIEQQNDSPEDLNSMKMRLVFPCDDILAQLGVDQPKEQNETVVLNTTECNKPQETTDSLMEQCKRPKGHAQFHSTHFDIRSSPIKPTSTVFRKFQINPEKLPKYDVQIIGASDDIEKEQTKDFDQTSADTLQEIFRENNIDMTCKDNVIEHGWIITANEKSEDGYTKSNNLIEPALLHVKDTEKTDLDNSVQMQTNDNDSRLMTSQEDSVLNFFDSLGNTCLSYPETEIRTHPVDFHLDLFSFPNAQ